MGMTSAVKLRSIVENAENVLAIELLAAAEALEHRRPLKGGAGVERAYGTVRKYVEAVAGRPRPRARHCRDRDSNSRRRIR